MGFTHRTTSKKHTSSSKSSSRSHSKNSSFDLINNSTSPLPISTPQPKKSISRLKSSDSSKTNNSSLDSNNYLGIGTCFSTPNNNNASYSSNSTNSETRTRHCSDNSGLSASCHDRIVKTETKRGSILSRRIVSVTQNVCTFVLEIAM